MTGEIDETRRIAAELTLPPAGVAATVALLDDGNTLPFIARYRKERTGGLDEEQLRAIVGALATLRALEARRAAIIGALTEAETLTPALAAALAAAPTRTALEDLYAPVPAWRANGAWGRWPT